MTSDCRVSSPCRTSSAGSSLRLEEAGDPQQRLQVAQAALALLDVGLEHEAGIAHALMALVALGELGLDERGARARR